ncbi:MAG: c-type cytochrome biogenesis protein CcsB [Mycobacteriaceae bacterium]
MPVNETLSLYSDVAFRTAVLLYLFALLLLVSEFASVRTRTIVARELVGNARSSSVVAESKDTPGRVLEPGKRELSDRLGRMGLAVVYVGFIVHLVSVVLRGLATHRLPWGNMYEFVTLTVLASVFAALVVLRTAELRPLWAVVLLPVVILLFVAGTKLYADAGPVVPALRSYWLPIHVSIISIGSGVFLVSGAASAMFLLRIRYPQGEEGNSFVGRLTTRMPGAQTLDRIAYKTVVFAFPVFGAGVICGAIWAEAAWGRFWGWDPKETVSFIAWVIYAAYLHARATARWRDTRAAWINIAGFTAMLFNLFIINIVVSGLHSYAGLS